MDLCFLFWSIAVGICCGARVMEVAFILSALLTILVVILNMLPVGRAPMILVMNLKDIKEESEVIERVKKYARYYKIKSRNISMMKCNMAVSYTHLDVYKRQVSYISCGKKRYKRSVSNRE